MTRRTDEQNAAMHLYFRWLAQALLEKHFDFRDLTVEIPANEYMVKEHMWKSIQKKMTGKKSTKDLEINEVSIIYDILNRALIDKLDIHVRFPNKEDLAIEAEIKRREILQKRGNV